MQRSSSLAATECSTTLSKSSTETSGSLQLVECTNWSHKQIAKVHFVIQPCSSCCQVFCIKSQDCPILHNMSPLPTSPTSCLPLHPQCCRSQAFFRALMEPRQTWQDQMQKLEFSSTTCVRAYVCVVCACMCVHGYMCVVCVCMHSCMYVCVRACVHVHVRVTFCVLAHMYRTERS